jgi:hypothetical protein
MADITKCTDNNCPFHKHCYRYNAKSSDWQSFFLDSPRTVDVECKEYWGDLIEYIKIKLRENELAG